MAAHSNVIHVDMVVHGPLTVCTGAMPTLAQYHQLHVEHRYP